VVKISTGEVRNHTFTFEYEVLEEERRTLARAQAQGYTPPFPHHQLQPTRNVTNNLEGV